MKSTLFVAANRAKARMFTCSGPKGGLHHEEAFDYSWGREHDQSFITDSHGRHYDRGASPHKSSYSKEHDIDEQLVLQFAGQIAQRIEKRRTTNSFEHLILAGDPKFVGHLKQALGKACQKRILALIPKDVVGERTQDLQKRISELLKDYPELFVESG